MTEPKQKPEPQPSTRFRKTVAGGSLMLVCGCGVLLSATAGNTGEQQFTPPKMRYGIFYDVAYGAGAPVMFAPPKLAEVSPSDGWQTVRFVVPHAAFTHYSAGKSKLTLWIRFSTPTRQRGASICVHQFRVRPKRAEATEWLSVTAGEPNDTSAEGRNPGVYFCPGWTAPAEYKGRMARRRPNGVDMDMECPSPNNGLSFFVESPDPNCDLEVEATLATGVPLTATFWGASPRYDLRTKENVKRLFDRVSALGINMATYAYAFWPPFVNYPSDDPKLKEWGISYPKQWREIGFDPVAAFLDETKAHGMEAFLGSVVSKTLSREFFSGGERTPAEITVEGMKDMVSRYGKHPGLTGLTSPTEASADWPDNVFADVCRQGKGSRDKLLIMEYPYGPGGASQNAKTFAHADSGVLDVMNVQIHTGAPAYFDPDFLLIRGWSQYVLGGCAPTPTLIHTHHYEGDYPGRRGRFMTPRSEAWKVRLGALLTATPYGCHQWSYLMGFHGADGISGEDTLWRWNEWSKAILFVQRLAPYYANAQNCAPVGMFVPEQPSTHIQDNALLWRSVAAEGRPAQFVNAKAGFDAVKVLLLPDGKNVSNEELAAVRKFAQDGGRAVLIPSAHRFIGADWLSVTAGERNDDNSVGRTPGVHFYFVGWAAPAEYNGKVARKWASLGGTFFVENPDPAYDLEVEVTLCTEKPLTANLYPGVNLGKVEPSGDWQTLKFIAPREKFAHYSEGRGVLTLMLQLTSQAPPDETKMFVHSVRVRRTGEKGKPTAKVKVAMSGVEELFGVTPENIAPGERQLGAGKLIVVGADELGKVIKTEAPPVPSVEGADDGWALEAYEAREKTRRHGLYLLLSGKDGAEAKDVVLHLPDPPSRAMIINENEVKFLPMAGEAGGSKVTIGRVHEWAAVVVGKNTFPVLYPMPVSQTARVGQEVKLTVRVANPRAEAIDGTMDVDPPQGWQKSASKVKVRIGAGQQKDFAVVVRVPEDAEKEVYFIRFSLLGLEQRALVLVEDGKPRRILSKAR